MVRKKAPGMQKVQEIEMQGEICILGSKTSIYMCRLLVSYERPPGAPSESSNKLENNGAQGAAEVERGNK